MKTIVSTVLLFALLLIAPRPCLARMSLRAISKEQAKQVGMELLLKEKGANEVLVELEFKAEGVFKDFNYVSLEISEREKLLVGYAPLKAQPSDSGRVHIEFIANRTYLEKITLRVVTGFSRNMAGHDLRVKDFVEPEKAPLK